MAKYVLLNEVPGFKPGDILDTVQGDPVFQLIASGNILVPWSESLQSVSDFAALLYRSGAGTQSVFASVIAGYAIRKGSNSLVWNPQGGGDVQTWDDVMLAIENSVAPVKVYGSVGQTHVIPKNSIPYNVKGMHFEFPLGDSGSSIVKIEDGATLDNCHGGDGAFTLEGNNVSDTLPLTWSEGNPPIFLQQFGNYFKQSGIGPMFAVPDNGFIVLAARQGGGFVAGSGNPAFTLGANALCLLTSLLSPLTLPTNTFTGPATATVVFQHDGNAVYPGPGVLPGYLGGIVNGPFGNFGGVGPTSFRPLPLFSPLPVGISFVDTTVSAAKPIWFDGTDWVDANGVVVP